MESKESDAQGLKNNADRARSSDIDVVWTRNPSTQDPDDHDQRLVTGKRVASADLSEAQAAGVEMASMRSMKSATNPASEKK